MAGAGLILVWGWLALGVPLASRASEGMSDASGETVFTLMLFGPMLVVAIGLASFTGTLSAWSLRGLGRGLGGGAALGLAGLALAIVYCAVAGTMTVGGSAVSAALPLGVASIGLQVIAEEAMFRGYLQPLLVRGIGATAGVAASAAGFALLHGVAAAADLVTIANMLLGGLLFGVLALRGGIAAAVGAHLAWNGMEQLGLGLDPNPGTGAFGSLIDLDLVGAVRWGGSEAGLNASWAMTFALGATLAFLLSRTARVGSATVSAMPRAVRR